MTSRLRWSLLAGVTVLWGGLACGSDSGGGPPASGRKTVLVANNEFQPVTVSITAGDTILWSWSAGSVTHNILSTGAPAFVSKGTNGVPGVLDLDYFSAPESYQVVFGAAGTYEYYCSQHGTTGGVGGNTGMQGTVQVSP
jgi:plastocyanin